MTGSPSLASWLRGWPDWLPACAAVLMALGLNYHLILDVGGTQVRLSAADVVMVALLPFILQLGLRQRGRLKLAGLQLPLLIAAATMALTWGLVHAATTGGAGVWVFAKFAGWFILLCYAAAAAVLAGQDPVRTPRLFALGLVIPLCLLTIIYIAVSAAGMYWSEGLGPRFTGLSGNPNAVGLSLLCGCAFLLAYEDGLISMPARMRWLNWKASLALLSAGIIFTRSIAALIGLMVIVLMYLAMRRRIVPIMQTAAMTTILIFLPVAGTYIRKLPLRWPGFLDVQWGVGDKIGWSVSDKIGAILSSGQPDPGHMYDLTIASRLESNLLAISYWWEQPFLGIGLGQFLQLQIANNVSPALIIHNTPLWLLTELGLLGAGVFLALFAAVFIWLWQALQGAQAGDRERASLLFAAILVLTVWAFMSLGHELMYQRVPWVILGLCVGVSGAAASRPSSSTGGKYPV